MSYKTCGMCGRPVLYPLLQGTHDCHTGVVAYVVHDAYGCDTGCCGHRAFLVDPHGNIVDQEFDFDHPYGTPKEDFIRHLIAGRWLGVVIDFERCQIIDND